MRKRFLFSALLISVLSFSAMQPLSYADATSDMSLIEPYYNSDARAGTQLKIQGTTATCFSSIRSDEAVEIAAEQTLQKQGFLWIWGGVDGASWTKTLSADYVSMSNIASGLESGLYRLKTEFTLTLSSGKTETITVYSNEQRVP